MELDTSIMQTKTVGNIIKVLEQIETVIKDTKLVTSNAYDIRSKVAEIINKREIAISLITSYKE